MSTSPEAGRKRGRQKLATKPAGASSDLRGEQARIFDISQDAIFMFRLPGGIESWNQGAVQLYGYEQKEVVGRHPAELLSTKAAVPWEQIETQLRSAGSWRGELVHHTRAGKALIVSARLQSVPQQAGEPLLILESNRDISDLKSDAARLERRLREQAVTARFSLDALQATAIQTVCDDAAHILRENLDVDFSAIYECRPDCTSMLLRSGVGWRPGHVGVTTVEIGEQTPTGRALDLNQPIIISDVRGDSRLRLPQFIRDHGVVSSMAVVIPGRPSAFGVLSVDTKSLRTFSTDDLNFLEAIGNVVATATSRLKFEAELRDTAARLRGIVETAVDGIITIDERGIVETMNPAAERIFGFPAAEVIGHNVSMLMPEPYRSEHDGYLERYRRTGERRIIGIGREVRGRRKDGSEFPMDLGVSGTTVGKRRIFTGLVRDITERKRLEQEILEISDHEQRRIGSDLHDDLCQRLAGIRFSCDALKTIVNKSGAEAVSERLDKIAAAISESIDHTRMLARGLSPVALEANGLVSALHELAEGVKKLFGVECVFEAKGTISLNDTMVATHLYRITQEAISNALKHGHPSRLVVSLEKAGDKGVLTVRDDGAGFAMNGQRSTGMGLRTISYRAHMISADLRMQSQPGKGTEIVCTFGLD